MIGLKKTSHCMLTNHEILVIFISLLSVLWIQAPRLFDPYVAEEDLRYFYQFNNFQEPELFSNNYLRPILHLGSINLMGENIVIYYDSIAYGLLFYLASYFFTPVMFSKILPFFLLPITTLYLLKYGQAVSDRKQSLIFAIGFVFLNIISSSSLSVISAIPRIFSLPLVIVFIYYLERKQYLASAVTVGLSAAFYPPTSLLQMLTWSFTLLYKNHLSNKKISINYHSLKYLMLSGFFCGLVLSPILIQILSAPLSERKLSESIHSFIQGGRYQLFDVYPFVGNGGLFSNQIDFRHFSALYIVAVLIVVFLRKKSFWVPRLINLIFLSSITLFIASWLIALITDSFLLYLPSRYPRVGLFLFMLAFLSFNLIDFIKEAPKIIYHNQRIKLILGVGELLVLIAVFSTPSLQDKLPITLKIMLIILLLLVLGLLVYETINTRKTLSPRILVKPMRINNSLYGLFFIIIAIPILSYAKHISNASFLHPSKPHRELLDYIKSLPSDMLIAGSPCLLDNIPFFSKRQILFSCELDTNNSNIITQALDAYYAEDFTPLSNLCLNYDIDYIVIDQRTYSDEFILNGWIFFEPYNENIYPIVSQRDSYILTQVPDTAKTFLSEPFYVVSCEWIIETNLAKNSNTFFKK